MLDAPELMQRKKDDHHAPHSNGVNQFFHLLSSSTLIYCSILSYYDLTTAMGLGLATLFVGQFGHAIVEPPCHDKEKLLLGFNTRNKTFIVLGHVLIQLIPISPFSKPVITQGAPTSSASMQEFLALLRLFRIAVRLFKRLVL